mgnify:CR=1 FL=1
MAGGIDRLPIVAVLATMAGLLMPTAPQEVVPRRICGSFLISLPPLLILALALTRMIAAGESDLSFLSILAVVGPLPTPALGQRRLLWPAVPSSP